MFTLSLLLSLRVRLSLVTKTVSTLIFSSHSFSKGLMKWSHGTKARWKNSPYAHLPLGGKPQASCTPFQRSPGLARQTTSKQRKLLVENILFMYLEPKKMTWEYYVVSGFWNPLQGYGITILSLQWILQNIHHLEICKANSFHALVSANCSYWGILIRDFVVLSVPFLEECSAGPRMFPLQILELSDSSGKLSVSFITSPIKGVVEEWC